MENGLVCIISADIYRVSGLACASPTALTLPDVAVDTCTGFNIIARASLPLGREAAQGARCTHPTLGKSRQIASSALGRSLPTCLISK